MTATVRSSNHDPNPIALTLLAWRQWEQVYPVCMGEKSYSSLKATLGVGYVLD